MKKIFLLLTSVLFVSCNLTEIRNEQLTKDFFRIYSEGKYIDSLMNFYTEDAVLDDVILYSVHEGVENIKIVNKEYFNYKRNPKFPDILRVDKIISSDSLVIIKGMYNPCYYNEIEIDSAYFNILLHLNKQGKIKRQENWVQYPINVLEESLEIRKNMQIN